MRLNFKLSFLFCTLPLAILAQKPADGIYTFKLAFDEWSGKVMGNTCQVIVKGDSIYVIHNGDKNLTGNKDDTLAAGILIKHKATGFWILANKPEDRFAKEINGCGDGPTRIDFKRRIFYTC